mgnify:FL=1
MNEANEANINIIIATNLRIARQVKGLTLQDIGKLLGITYQQCQKYETGKHTIPICKLLIMANHMDIPISFFFEKFELVKKAS